MKIAEGFKISELEYLEGELFSQLKHELIDGEAYAMAGASTDHNRISISFTLSFSNELKGKSCEPFMADMKVGVENNFYYPDVMVVCEEHNDDTEYVKYAPKLIVEVLSKSTRLMDHSIKLKNYIKIPSLEYYVIVEQDYCEISVLSRAAGFIPKYYYLGDEIKFPAIDAKVVVNDIYERIQNEDKERYLKSLEEKEASKPN